MRARIIRSSSHYFALLFFGGLARRATPDEARQFDQVFANEAIEDPGASRVATAIITPANNPGLQTIAEGVETPEQREFLLKRNCTTMQGDFFARPQPADESASPLASERPLPVEEKSAG